MIRLCTTPGCTNKYLAKGLCRKCYDDRPEQVRRRTEYAKRWAKNNPEKKRAGGLRCYYRHRDTYLEKLAAKRRENGVLPWEEYLRRHRTKSGYRGVEFHKPTGLWCARINVNGRRISLKYYKTPEEAARAYNEAVDKYFPDTPHYKNPLSSQEGL